MGWVGVITNVGLNLLGQFRTGTTLFITKVQTGNGLVSQESMKDATELTSPIDVGIVSSAKPILNGTMFKLSIGGGESSYTLKEVGLFAKIGENGSETLLALFQNSTDTITIPSKSSFPDYAYRLSVPLGISDTDNISITIDPEAYVSYGDFEDAVGDIEYEIASLASSVEDLVNNSWKTIYPVGSIYMSVLSTSPATLFGGGTWERLKDRFLLGAGDTYENGTTGGAASQSYTPSGTVGDHALTVEEIPSHNHTFTGGTTTTSANNRGHTHSIGAHSHGMSHTHGVPDHSHSNRGSFWTGSASGSGWEVFDAGGGGPGGGLNIGGGACTTGGASRSSTDNSSAFNSGGESQNHTHTVNISGSIGNTGDGNAHNHTFTGTQTTISTMPPYLAVYMWKRTA